MKVVLVTSEKQAVVPFGGMYFTAAKSQYCPHGYAFTTALFVEAEKWDQSEHSIVELAVHPMEY